MEVKNVYHLYVKPEGYWKWACQIEASDHVEALRKAINSFEPEHAIVPICLEQRSGFPVESNN